MIVCGQERRRAEEAGEILRFLPEPVVAEGRFEMGVRHMKSARALLRFIGGCSFAPSFAPRGLSGVLQFALKKYRSATNCDAEFVTMRAGNRMGPHVALRSGRTPYIVHLMSKVNI